MVFKCGTKVKKIDDIPIKDGFVFSGWTYNNHTYNFGEKLDKDIIVVANYNPLEETKIVTVSFNTDGGSEVQPIQVKKGNKITPPLNPKKSGYSFYGWYYGSELFDFDFLINENLVLTAHWKKGEGKDKNNEKLNNNISNNINSEKSDTGNTEFDLLVNNLLGTWYYSEDPSINITAAYTYIKGNKALEFSWSSIDLYKHKIYPNEGYGSSMYFTVPFQKDTINQWLNSVQIKFNGNTLKVFNKYTFTKDKKLLDLTMYDNYLGKWYLVGGNRDSFVEIKKESDSYNNIFYRLTVANSSNGNNNYKEYPAEQITQKKINEHNTLFDKHNIKVSNGYLIYENNSYSKNKNESVIKAENVYLDVPGSNSIFIGDTIRINTTFNPLDATDISGTWSSDNTKVATVNQDGLVTGISKGSANICFKTVGKLKACQSIYVENIKVTDVNLSLQQVSLNIGEKKKISVTVFPENATIKDYTWTISAPNVISVQDGYIIAKGVGTAKLTVTTNDGNINDYCYITVNAIPVTSISLNVSEINLIRTNTKNLNVSVYPENATNKKIVWTTSDSKVVIVDSNGKVTAIGKGNATITATTEDGNYSASCVVNVINPALTASANFNQSSITIGGEQITKKVGVSIKASGGTGSYRYDIQFYKNGELISQVTNSMSNSITIDGGEAASYTANYTVTDSNGESFSGSIGPITY